MLSVTPPNVVNAIKANPILRTCLPVLARHGPEDQKNQSVCVLKVAYEQSHVQYLDLTPSDMIALQTSRTLHLLCDIRGRTSPNGLRMFPSLQDLLRRRVEWERIFARTGRMLLWLEALLLEPGDLQQSEAGDLRVLRSDANHLKEAVPGLQRALAEVRGTFLELPLTTDGAVWEVWLPLLMVFATSLSQSEYFRPVCWEAYSAGRIRADLSHVLHIDLGKISDPTLRADLEAALEKVLDVIALLVRYQSAEGQRARGTTGSNYLEIVKEVANESRFPYPALAAAFQIIGVVEEARNHRLPDFDDDQMIGQVRINKGVNRPWDWEKSRVLAERIFSAAPDGAPTWSFASVLQAPADCLKTFKGLVQANYMNLLPKEDRRRVEEGKVEWFTFDRGQTEDLKGVLREQLVAAAEKRSLAGRFHLSLKTVPTCFGRRGSELVIVVLLDDRAAARHLLFAAKGSPMQADGHASVPAEYQAADPVAEPLGPTAGALLAYLFKLVVEAFDLEKLALRKGDGGTATPQKMYMPFALLDRLLELVYRLRPETCASVPISFDGGSREVVHIPGGLNKNKDALLIRLIGNFVPAVILNQAMSVGFRTCDINVDGLLAHDAPLGGADDPMSGKDWVGEIKNAVLANGYELLADRYLRDYNTERKSFEFRDTSSSLTLKTIPTSAVRSTLERYLVESRQDRTATCVLLGIDIGGTLTKFQFYRFSRDSSEPALAPLGRSFRMLTADQQPPGGNRAQQFAQRMVKTLVASIHDIPDLKKTLLDLGLLAVGISWPGPVRSNHVAGTSGTVEVFGLNRMIRENKIEDILSIDLAGAFTNCCRSSPSLQALLGPPVMGQPHTPYVALLNDGTADGVGILAAKAAGAMPGRLAVVKLGTGTAGAVFLHGRLEDGLSEWGKMLLDLAAPANKAFPEGTVNLHLSKKTMPADARARGGVLSQVANLDALELGLLLEAEAKSFDPDSLNRLRRECGILDLVASDPKIPIGVDAEVLRRTLEKGQKVERDIFLLIERYLKELGREAEAALDKAVGRHGIHRLEELLGHRADTLLEMFDPKDSADCRAARARELLGPACEVARHSAEALGTYLGDFIVQLHDIYKMDAAVLGGGVLSGRTGAVARAKAVERIRMYRLQAADTGEYLVLGQGAAGATAGPLSQGVNTGTLGAATFAAAEYLFHLKGRGITKIKAGLMKLRADESVEVYADRVVFQGIHRAEVPLGPYGLTAAELNEYLGTDGIELGFFKSRAVAPPTGPEVVYTRWEIE
jgi:hypothetical protein